jgi:hypothetical protein
MTWDLVRRAVDAGAHPGQFLLTGSASPHDPGRHSGALTERGYQPAVSLAALLSGDQPRVDGASRRQPR